MRFTNVIRSLQSKRSRNSSLSLSFSHHLHSKSDKAASFGIAFDIDGVIIRGESPIGNSPQALRRLYGDSGILRIPYLFLTNGGGIPESKRASELSGLLGVNILTSQILQGHTPFKDLVHSFQNGLVVAVGKGEPATVMSEYGFKNVLSVDEYASYFDNIDPLSRYKHWASKKESIKNNTSIDMATHLKVHPDRVEAVFVVSDSVDWSRDIQVLCDILRTGGLPGREISHQPPLYFASDDLEYQAAFPSNRLGMGAFRIALESIFNRIHPKALDYTSFGKPNPFVFKNAEAVLKQLHLSTHHLENGEPGGQTFKTLYMIGDNPSVDIKGARQAGQPWFSILTRTGVFKGKGNHEEFPADLVVDTVEDAVEYILERECTLIALLDVSVWSGTNVEGNNLKLFPDEKMLAPCWRCNIIQPQAPEKVIIMHSARKSLGQAQVSYSLTHQMEERDRGNQVLYSNTENDELLVAFRSYRLRGTY